MVLSRLPDRPIWYPFNFFNKNDNGFTERMNNNTERLSPWKIPRRSYLIGYLDWLNEDLLTNFVSKFQWLILQVVALLLILNGLFLFYIVTIILTVS